MLKNIWVIQTAFLGDCVLSLPFIYRLCELNPDAHIHLITSKAGFDVFHLALQRGLLEQSTRLHLHLFEKRGMHKGLLSLWRFVKHIREFSGGAPDTVYCLQRSARSGLMALLSKATLRVGFSTGSASYFYTRLVPRTWNNGKSEIEKNLDLLRAVEGVEKVAAWLPATAPSLLAPRNQEAFPKVAVSLALGSPWPTKRWPVENAAQMADHLAREGIELHLLGDSSAKELAVELKNRCSSLLVKDFVGLTNMRDWVDQIAASRAVVCNDSAATHVASDLGIPCVVLFGPTLPEFGFAPWRRKSLALGIGNLYCRPCHIHGPKKCPESHHRCLKQISGEQVFRTVFKMIQMG